jgi:predicted acyl esterase
MRRDAPTLIGTSVGVGVLAAVCGAIALASPALAADRATATFVARGSVEQVHVTGAGPGTKLTLVDKHGDEVETKTAGPLGGIVFRRVDPGVNYRVRQGSAESSKLRVLTDRPRPKHKKIYDQDLPAGGYGYLRTRDGTQLAINVHLPGPAEDGPYPTLVEYSGYGYANPAGPQSGIQPIAELLGYAVVDVNMRGTGCSGGAFDYFEPLQSLDGYDVIETVARQPWALHGKVGMLGISYGGISQMFVGATRPPSLAAIAPLSVIDNSQTTLYPGGVLNTGFALEWAEDRDADAQAASPTTGQAWAWKRIEEGDEVCEANQDLHPQAINTVKKIRNNNYYRPGIADPVSPVTFVDEIDVPVFLACQWTDEQTGGHCPALADEFTGTDRKWFTFTNGTHVDSLAPATFNRWFDFLELYVARRKPELPPEVKAAAPILYAAIMGVPGVQLPDDPIQQQPDFASALAAFESLPAVRILFDNGAGAAPGVPAQGFERSFASFPVEGTSARSWYLAHAGALIKKPPTGSAKDSFTWNAAARPATDFTGNTGGGPGGLWTATPPYNWTQNPAGTAASYLTPPLHGDTAVIGGGALEAWIRSSVPDADLQVTVSEVRPDGRETFVQSGWLRGSVRKLDPVKSTLLEPVLSLREADAAPFPTGSLAKVTVPLYYQGHVYRAGSQIRVTISAVGGDQPIWAFGEAVPGSPAQLAIARSPGMPSRLLLPEVDGVDAPTALPPCPALRGQPCRDYQPYANQSSPLR